MKLHWSPRSPYVRKVMVCAHELGLVDQLELTRTVVAMTKPHEELMRDNPLSKIPTLVLDDGTILYDSLVICEYLNEQAAGPLFPSQGAAKWTTLRRHALGDGLLDGLILWRNEREREAPSQVLLEAFERKAHATLAHLDREAPELDAAPFSIAHVAIGCAMSYLDFRFADIDWRRLAPTLAAWHASIAKRPSFEATAAREG